MDSAMVVQRIGGADGFGHVGWAYQRIDGTWMCGATENPGGHIGGTGDAKGFWALVYSSADVPRVFGVPRMLPAGECPPYDNYKVIRTDVCNASEAWSKACWCRDRPFAVPNRDCLDDTYDILTAYGVTSLPLPIIAEPNLWFDLIPSRAIAVPCAAAPLPPGSAQTPGEGSAPIWRIPGSVEYAELAALRNRYSGIGRI